MTFLPHQYSTLPAWEFPMIYRKSVLPLLLESTICFYHQLQQFLLPVHKSWSAIAATTNLIQVQAVCWHQLALRTIRQLVSQKSPRSYVTPQLLQFYPCQVVTEAAIRTQMPLFQEEVTSLPHIPLQRKKWLLSQQRHGVSSGRCTGLAQVFWVVAVPRTHFY